MLSIKHLKLLNWPQIDFHKYRVQRIFIHDFKMYLNRRSTYGGCKTQSQLHIPSNYVSNIRSCAYAYHSNRCKPKFGQEKYTVYLFWKYPACFQS